MLYSCFHCHINTLQSFVLGFFSRTKYSIFCVRVSITAKRVKRNFLSPALVNESIQQTLKKKLNDLQAVLMIVL